VGHDGVVGHCLISIIAVLVFVVWLAADTLKSRAVRHQRDAASVQPFLLSISEAFDPIHSILWQAPSAALELIDSGGKSGIPARNCAQFMTRRRVVSQRSTKALVSSRGFSFWKRRS
jgi:hypothetical protein